MDFFGYPIWVVLLVCAGVFCASFMDAIGGGGGIISHGGADVGHNNVGYRPAMWITVGG